MLSGVVPPLVIAAVLLLAAWRPWKRGTASRGDWGSALALALSYAVADRMVRASWPGWPPATPDRWLPIIGLAAGAFFAFDPFRSGRKWFGYGALAVAFAALAPLVWDGLTSRASLPHTLLITFLYAMVMVIIWSDALAAGRPPRAAGTALILLIVAVGASLTFLQSFVLSFAQMAGAIAAVTGVTMLVALWRPDLDVLRGQVPVYSILVVGLIAVCSEITLWSALALLAAAAMPGLATSNLTARLRPWQRTVIAAAAAAGLCVVAVWKSPSGFDFGGY
jgi:hypothetical protein